MTGEPETGEPGTEAPKTRASSIIPTSIIPTSIMAEFDDPRALLAAARQFRAEGYLGLETYSPFPLEDEVEENPSHGPIRAVMLAAGVAGAVTGFYLQYWTAVIEYPINSGGRPPFSWPAFMLVTFELTVLFAALAGFVAFIVSAGLTRLHHPVFATPGFERASSDRFFLAIPGGDQEKLAPRLEKLGAVAVRGLP